MKTALTLIFVAMLTFSGCKNIQTFTEAPFCPADRSGGIPRFSEQNFAGIPSAEQIKYLDKKPVEFTGRVVNIYDRASLLADDPKIIPYTIKFELVKGSIPGYPKAKQFLLDPQWESGVNSIDRFEEGQEIVFIGRPDGGSPFGMKNVLSSDELKK